MFDKNEKEDLEKRMEHERRVGDILFFIIIFLFSISLILYVVDGL